MKQAGSTPDLLPKISDGTKWKMQIHLKMFKNYFFKNNNDAPTVANQGKINCTKKSDLPLYKFWNIATKSMQLHLISLQKNRWRFSYKCRSLYRTDPSQPMKNVLEIPQYCAIGVINPDEGMYSCYWLNNPWKSPTCDEFWRTFKPLKFFPNITQTWSDPTHMKVQLSLIK